LMGKTELTISSGYAFKVGDYISICNSRWRTKNRIIDTTPNVLTIKWAWWMERWFQYPVIVFVWGLAAYVNL